MRVLVVMVSRETNTFGTIPTHRGSLAVRDLRYGVVTSRIHDRAAFAPPAGDVDAPGFSSSNLARVDFTRVRRPIFPLDDL